MAQSTPGARTMVRHLLAIGHRDVALIAGPADNFDAQQRELGYRAAMAEAATGAQPVVIPGDFTEASGYRAGLALLARKPVVRAVFAANDMMAVGCLAAFAEAGVSVPETIAVAGFDDIPIARYVEPPLTTVHVRIADLGRHALMRLVAAIEQPDGENTREETLDCQIVVRASCGAATGKAVPRKSALE